MQTGGPVSRRGVILGAAAIAATTLPATQAFAAPLVSDEIFDLTNAVRQENRLWPLLPNRRLNKAARRYAEVLADSAIFSHSADGTRLSHRVQAAGYRYRYVAENIAWVQRPEIDGPLARRFMTGWMRSLGHRRNILARHPSELGVGVVKRGDRFYAVQVFGARL